MVISKLRAVIFTFTHKLGYTMGLIDKRVPVPEPKKPTYEFTLSEVDALIRALSTSHFPTKDIEILYNGIFKLQELRRRLDEDGQN